MTAETLTRINTAIKDCLAQCYGADNPIARLAQYVQRLHSDRRWTDREITYFEIAVLKLLRMVA